MASSKNYTEVLIGGKVFTLSGFESEEYLQKVSTYLNHKIAECASVEGFNRQSAETRSTLLALNIADDYFKAKRQGANLEQDVERKDKEMYDLKHELISTQIRCENLEQELRTLKEEKQKLQMQIVKLIAFETLCLKDLSGSDTAPQIVGAGRCGIYPFGEVWYHIITPFSITL